MSIASTQLRHLNEEILVNMAPYLLQAVALILATLLFWHAWQWQKRKAQR